MLSLRKPAREQLHGLLESWRDDPLSYMPPLTSGFIADEHEVKLGCGEEIYRAACEALDAWGMFPAWAEVARHEVKGQAVGQIVAMEVRICGLWWVNPCRILRRCDSAHTHGFVYGTLPEHAECGEEQFIIERRPDGSVWYVIRAFSHPRHWMAWLGFPLARWWQCRFVRDSQQKMREAAAAQTGMPTPPIPIGRRQGHGKDGSAGGSGRWACVCAQETEQRKACQNSGRLSKFVVAG